VEALFKKWKDAEAEVEKARSLACSAEWALREVVAKHFGIEDEYDCTIGVHDCPESPIGLCVYNNADDPCNDFCLVCGKPHERK
jgi:hypothetical protein